PPISICNDVDNDISPPWEFQYSDMMRDRCVARPGRQSRVSCSCVGICGEHGPCDCLTFQRQWTRSWGIEGFAFDRNGRLIDPNHPIFECNDLCGCDERCPNRIIQNGRRMPLTIAKTQAKGWGVTNGSEVIHAGEFVGIYSGEILEQREAQRRGRVYDMAGRTYLFDLDFWFLHGVGGSKTPMYTVDASQTGNFTRFLNHSCDPNLLTVAAYVNESDLAKPLITFFARRDIQPGEELTFSYYGVDEDSGEDDDNGTTVEDEIPSEEIHVPCLCGARKCKGKPDPDTPCEKR
ncbi:SET domain-containing protein, partial [Schizophyllum commune]